MWEERFGLLYAQPSFAEGVGRLFDFGCTTDIYNASSTPEEADFNALREDWRAIARDLGQAFDEFTPSKPQKTSATK